LTAHSPVGLNPQDFGIIPNQKEIGFAHNDVEFKDKTGINHQKFSEGLRKSLFNYMHGICFEFPLQDWFDFKIPRTSIKPDFIRQVLNIADFTTKSSAKIIWLGDAPETKLFTKSKKGQTWELMSLTFHQKKESFTISLDKDKGEWLKSRLRNLAVSAEKQTTFNQLKQDFETTFEDFELFWFSKPIQLLRNNGLLAV
jgi:hypothetical protein